MRFNKDIKIKTIFALVPHYCVNTGERVWLERVWRITTYYMGKGKSYYRSYNKEDETWSR